MRWSEMVRDTELLALYRTMVLIREFEEACRELHVDYPYEAEVHRRRPHRGCAPMIRGMIHLCTGQEATTAGVCAVMGARDQIVTTYRGHGPILARGADPRRVLLEIVGKQDGYNAGRAGSMHVTVPEVGHIASFATVGANIPVGVGAAFSAKLERSDRAVVCFFGDGAVNAGMFHESLNLAMLWRVPIVFVCENNHYAMTTATSVVTSVCPLAHIASPYGMPLWRVDGNDVLAVADATHEAIGHARRDGPAFIEADTYRLTGHVVADPWDGRYRSIEEIEAAHLRDPIPAFRARLLGTQGIDAVRIDELDRSVRALIDHIVAAAEDAPWPDPESILGGGLR